MGAQGLDSAAMFGSSPAGDETAAATAPSTEKADDLRAKLQDAYSEQPAWAKLFTAWRAQQQGKPAYSSPLEEGKRFAAFKANLLRMEGTSARNYLADKHADKTHDEMRTFAHFA